MPSLRTVTGPLVSTCVVALSVSALAFRAPAQEVVPLPDLEDVEELVERRVHELYRDVQARPGSAVAWGRYGMVLEAHGFVDEARPAYRRAHELDGGEFRWPYYLAALYDSREPEVAVDWYRRAIALDSGYAPARIRLAQTLETLGRGGEAKGQYENAVKLDPQNPFGFLGLGRIALSRGDLDAAVQHLERAYAIDPRIQAVVATLAQAYHRSGKTELARRRGEEARELPRVNYRPDQRRVDVKNQAVDVRSYLRRSRAHRDRGELRKALEELRVAIGLAPELAEAQLAAAELHVLLGDPQSAVDSAFKALEASSELAGVHSLLAASLVQLQRFEEAVAHAREALKREPGNTYMLLLLSMVAAEDGRIGDLVSFTERAFESGPRDDRERQLLTELLSELGFLYAADGNYDAAAHKMDQILSLAAEAGDPAPALAPYRQRRDAYRSGRH